MAKKDNHKEVIVFFRVAEDVKKKILKMAQREHRKQGNMITVLIHEAIQARENVNSGS